MDLFSLEALILAAALYYVWLLSKHWRFNPNLPPGPFNLPIVGCLHKLGSLPHISLHNLSKKYGGVMYLKLGSIPVVVISTEEAAKEMNKLYGVKISSRAPLVAGHYFGNNDSSISFSPYTPQVKLYRKLVSIHLLSPNRFKVYEEIRREELRRLVQSLRDQSGSPVLLRKKFHEANMNVITYMLFGKRFHGGASTVMDYDFVMTIGEILRISGLFNLSDYIPGIRWLDVQGLEKQYKKIMERVNGHLLAILRNRRDNPPVLSEEEPMAFIDVLIAMDSSDKEKLSDITKISLIHDMLLGGIESSALALEWAMADLLHNPVEFSRARREVDQVVGRSRMVNFSDLANLPYIQAVAKESLRFHSLAPLPLPRIVRGGPIKVGRYTIPDGTVIYTNTYSIGHDERFWKNPHDFEPQRFIDKDVDVFGQNFHFLPFGSGRRVCPGARFGFEAIQIGLATLVQGFEWKLAGNLDVKETFGLACPMTHPLVVAPVPRLDSHIY